MAKPILPPNASRIATEAGPVIKDKYDTDGLTCYREEFDVGQTKMVREGYIKVEVLPNGKTLYNMITTKVISRQEAEDNE
jgi:hypothetical protein